MSVTCKSKLEEIDGRKYTFNVECYDDIELIGTATHERFLINQNKFVNKANSKLHQ